MLRRFDLRSTLAITIAAMAPVLALAFFACGTSEEALRALPGASAPMNDGGPGESDADASVAACPEGSTRSCKVNLAQHGGVVQCFVGLQECKDGVWGACFDPTDPQPTSGSGGAGGETSLGGAGGAGGAGGSGGAASVDLDAGAAGAMQYALSYSDASSCGTDPCDPSCQQYTETPPDGGITLTPTLSGYYNEGSYQDLLANSPNGFVDKGLKKPCTTLADCQFDYHCVSGSCVPWKNSETISGCTKPDITVGLACVVGGQPTVPVCNRGNATAPAGVVLYIFPGNSVQFPTCTPDNNPGICKTTQPIPPGKCINVPNCPGLSGNGNKTIMGNPPKSVNPAWIDECTCTNNWGDWSGAGTCIQYPQYDTVATTYSQTYTGTCPSGTHVQWDYLAYATTTPSDSNIVFTGKSATTSTGLAAASPIALATAKATPIPDTELCSMAGPAPCPIDLYSKLGGPPLATNAFFQLSYTLNPSSDQSAGPTLTSWKITYSCPFSE